MNKNTYLTPKQIRDLEMIKLQDRIKELEEQVKKQKDKIIKLQTK